MRTVKLLIDRGEMSATYRAGDLISLPDDEATRYIEAGLAEPIETEAAMSGAPECAMRQPPTPRRRR